MVGRQAAQGFVSLDMTAQVADEVKSLEVLEDFTGDAIVAGYTVLYGSGQAPKGVALVDTSAGQRAMATTEDADLIAHMEAEELVGRSVRIMTNTLLAIG